MLIATIRKLRDKFDTGVCMTFTKDNIQYDILYSK